jgi:hypothetical protein
MLSKSMGQIHTGAFIDAPRRADGSLRAVHVPWQGGEGFEHHVPVLRGRGHFCSFGCNFVLKFAAEGCKMSLPSAATALRRRTLATTTWRT